MLFPLTIPYDKRNRTMATLYIMRSAPDAITKKLISELSDGCGATVLRLYDTEVDWENVVDLIFDHDHVVCWW